jgi:hypothetical protein
MFSYSASVRKMLKLLQIAVGSLFKEGNVGSVAEYRNVLISTINLITSFNGWDFISVPYHKMLRLSEIFQ